MASTATPGLHDAGVVPTWVLRNEATLSLIIEWARMSRVVWTPIPGTGLCLRAHYISSPEMSSNVIQLNAQFCTHGGYLHAIANTLTSSYYRFKCCNIFCIWITARTLQLSHHGGLSMLLLSAKLHWKSSKHCHRLRNSGQSICQNTCFRSRMCLSGVSTISGARPWPETCFGI